MSLDLEPFAYVTFDEFKQKIDSAMRELERQRYTGSGSFADNNIVSWLLQLVEELGPAVAHELEYKLRS
jgi:hypothetical protein